MKKKIILAVFFAAMLAGCIVCGACSGVSKNDQSAKPSQVSASSQTSNASDQESASQPSQESKEPSQQESQSSEESSSAGSGVESSQESSQESSRETSQESSGEESSLPEMYDGYYFDDEQIVEDYHTAVELTDDEAFNALFRENKLDQQFQQDIREVENEMDMRTVTIRYGELWKNEADEAYQKLADLLETVPAEKEKLEHSQEEWLASLEKTENSFLEETSDGDVCGTQALLAVDSAMMNYYKGRAAVLYQQIYVLTGSFEMD